jgi:hypothetical protein
MTSEERIAILEKEVAALKVEGIVVHFTHGTTEDMENAIIDIVTKGIQKNTNDLRVILQSCR